MNTEKKSSTGGDSLPSAGWSYAPSIVADMYAGVFRAFLHRDPSIRETARPQLTMGEVAQPAGAVLAAVE